MDILKTKAERFRVIANNLADLYQAKNTDYGDSFGKTYQELGIISSITRLHDKLNRIKSLTVNKQTLVVSESITDTLLDLAAYSIMTIIELEQDGTSNGE